MEAYHSDDNVSSDDALDPLAAQEAQDQNRSAQILPELQILVRDADSEDVEDMDVDEVADDAEVD